MLLILISLFSQVACGQGLVNGLQCPSNQPIHIPADQQVGFVYASDGYVFTINERNELDMYRVVGIGDLEHVARVQVGSLNPGDIERVEFEEGILYLLWRGDLRAVDFSDPSNPTLYDYPEDDWVYSFDVDGHMLYLSFEDEGLQSVDYSNPAEPIELWHEPGTYRSRMFVSGNRLFAMSYSVIRVYDITDPADPELILIDDENRTARHADMQGSLIAVAESSRLTLYEYTPDVGFSRISSVNGHRAERVQLVADRLYAMSDHSGLHVYDISDPAQPKLDSWVMDRSQQVSFGVNTGIVFTPGWDYDAPSINAFDLRQPNHAALSITDLQGSAVVVKDNLLYMQDRFEGLSVYDCADARQPELMYSEGMNRSQGRSALIHNNWLFSVAGSVHLYDISEPSQPQLISSISSSARWMQFDFPLLYTCASAGGSSSFSVIDYSRPDTPILLDSLILDDVWLGDFEIVDGTAYSPSLYDGLYRIDVRNPYDLKVREPILSDHMMYPGIARSGDLLVILRDGTENFLMGISVIDPLAPGGVQEISYFDDHVVYPENFSSAIDNGIGMVIHRDTLFVSEEDIYTYDLSDPLNVRFLSQWENRMSGGNQVVTDMLIENDRLYAINTNDDVSIYNAGPCADCPADLDNDLTSTAIDASRFIESYTTGSPAADMSGDGVLNFYDVAAFLRAYHEPCVID
jgi:hypothetical protein